MTSFRRWTVRVLVVLLAVHVAASAALVAFPGFRGGSLPVKVYTYFIRLGPFFREESIKSSPHLIVAPGNGAPRDLIMERVEAYQANPLRVSQLLVRDYHRAIGDALARNPADSLALAKLRHALDRRFPGEAYDSTLVVYYLNWYSPERKLHTRDTLVCLTLYR